MKRVRIYVYLDDAEQLRKLRIKAAEQGVSVSDLGKQAVIDTYGLSPFLPSVSDEQDKPLASLKAS